MRTVVLGAGVSGLAAAYGLSRIPGETYSIYEQQSRSGGYCQSQRVAGFTYDIVSHVLHFRTQEAEDLVRELLGEDLRQSKRSAWIYFRGRYIPYPFQTHLGFLPLSERTSCLTGYWRAWLNRRRNGLSEPKNFEEWVRLYLGDGIARHFMFPYNTKLWGKAPAELSVDWLRPFVPRTSWQEVMGNLLTKSVSEVGYNACFYYPKAGGIQALVDRLESRIAPVRLDHQAVEVNLDRKVVRFQNGQEARYDSLISTIPLKVLALRSTGLPEDLRQEAKELHSTSLLSLSYCVRRPLPHSFHWLYFPEPQYPFFRIVFPSNISPSAAPQNASVISVEISQPDKTRLDELEAATRKHLVELGFVRDEADIGYAARHYFDHAYPVHDLGRQARVSRLVESFKSRDVWTIGRFGAWRYSSIDDAIAEGLCAAQEAVATVPARARRLTRAAGAGAS
ncbi:MAG: FAD-dependent oxidoreductase [Acidobacteria bacterium]|nr:FAD-dependent oxidoreductase [Acidobacteriota bacterium]